MKITKIHFKLNTDEIQDHRYASGDDWWDPKEFNNQLWFKTVVADMGKRDYNFLVLIHALVEQYLCFAHGISDEDVTAFDTSKYGASLDDPGHSKKAPYHKEHEVSTQIEKIVSRALHVDWKKYDKTYDRVVKKWRKNGTDK